MIDLHLHTTASDGTLSPEALVERAARAGLTTISVTDHDTTAGLEPAARACGACGLTFVSGIEITAVEAGRDVHVLGYFFDPADRILARFLDAQRADRLRRVRLMAAKLGDLGYPIDVERLIASAAAGGERSVGRPALADTLVAAGHVVSRDEAFERLLGTGRPAFVPRAGVSPAEVIATIHNAGGLASLAHPGVLGMDALIPALAECGLDALEVRHSDHSPEQEAHYRRLAAAHGLLMSGGSDFHGEDVQHEVRLGAVTLGEDDFAALRARAHRA